MSDFEVGDLIAAPREGVAARKVHAIFIDSNGVKRFTFENLNTGDIFTHKYDSTDYRKFVPEPEKFEVGKRYKKLNVASGGWVYHCVFSAEKSAVLAAFYSDGMASGSMETDDLVSDALGPPVVGVNQTERPEWRLFA